MWLLEAVAFNHVLSFRTVALMPQLVLQEGDGTVAHRPTERREKLVSQHADHWILSRRYDTNGAALSTAAVICSANKHCSNIAAGRTKEQASASSCCFVESPAVCNTTVDQGLQPSSWCSCWTHGSYSRALQPPLLLHALYYHSASSSYCINFFALQVGFNMRKVTKGGVTIKMWDLGGQVCTSNRHSSSGSS